MKTFSKTFHMKPILIQFIVFQIRVQVHRKMSKFSTIYLKVDKLEQKQ